MPPDLEVLLDLASALAIGLLIGAERGWSARDSDDDQLAAGVRTCGLLGLLGGTRLTLMILPLMAAGLGLGLVLLLMV